jgi:hypothetical protein
MAEIRNYTGRFSSGRPASPGLTCDGRKLAFAEVARFVAEFPHG